MCFEGLARRSRRGVLYADHVRFTRAIHPYIYKWKNHFYEMKGDVGLSLKGDVGLSLHEKVRNKMPTPRHKVTHNPIPTSLFCFDILFVCLFVMNALGKANSTTS